MTDSHNATFWFSGQSGINVSHSSNVQLGGGIQQRQSPFLIIDYHPLPPPHTDFHETSGITLHLFNCSNITVHTVVIRAAPFMAVTAFQGYGNHIFSNIQLEPHPSREWVARRDAIHVSDLRLGPTLVNSTIGYTGDDFFNVHSTLLLVLNCSRISPQDASSPSINCLLVNPRVLPDAPRNTVYGTLSNLEFVQPGDVISFYQWPASDMAMRPILTDTKVRYLHDVSRQYGRDAQETLPSLLQYPPKTSWHEATNQTTKFEADEVWSVMLELNEPHHPYQYTPLPPLGSIATVDTISSAGAKIINNTFVDTNCNFGRFKSPGGVIQGNTFRQAGNENLELTALPQWLEGPVNVRDVQVVDNVFYVDQIQQLPVHCGPLCEHPGCDYGQCVQCPICDGYDTTWAKNITLQKNQIVPSIRATKEDSDAVDQTRH
ncbi:hypothetical protein IV203_024305 [Nitzschia inconspicua]|uniref:Uncharacterized protein n=1 Tax=Nitzschia inconspicua TaxID=303405 RepID=A0A9K3KC08_9STRA|nr:hypothetical protein IV203_024305 [Nitzschia inconspicua]